MKNVLSVLLVVLMFADSVFPFAAGIVSALHTYSVSGSMLWAVGGGLLTFVLASIARGFMPIVSSIAFAIGMYFAF